MCLIHNQQLLLFSSSPPPYKTFIITYAGMQTKRLIFFHVSAASKVNRGGKIGYTVNGLFLLDIIIAWWWWYILPACSLTASRSRANFELNVVLKRTPGRFRERVSWVLKSAREAIREIIMERKRKRRTLVWTAAGNLWAHKKVRFLFGQTSPCVKHLAALSIAWCYCRNVFICHQPIHLRLQPIVIEEMVEAITQSENV